MSWKRLPVLAGVVLPLWLGDTAALLAGSCTSHTPRTRWPGARRESQETRKPEMTGKRLQLSSVDLV